MKFLLNANLKNIEIKKEITHKPTKQKYRYGPYVDVYMCVLGQELSGGTQFVQ